MQEALSDHEEQQPQGTRRFRGAEVGKRTSQMQVAIRPRRKRIGEERDRVRSALLGCCCFVWLSSAVSFARHESGGCGCTGGE